MNIAYPQKSYLKRLGMTLCLVVSALTIFPPSVNAKDMPQKVGPFTPNGLLPDGVDSAPVVNPYTGEKGSARKGTIAATINNVALLNQKLPIAATQEELKKIQDIMNAFIELIPSLRALAVFDLFNPEEWVSSDQQPGRVLAGVLYLQNHPKEVTAETRQKLEKIKSVTKIDILSQEITKLLMLASS